jgi:hypothetical protein
MDDHTMDWKPAKRKRPTTFAAALNMDQAVDDELDAEDEDLFVILDSNGRIWTPSLVSYEKMDFSFRTFHRALSFSKTQLDVLRTNCRLCCFPFTDDAYWLPASMEPRCWMERIARAFFLRHTKGVKFDPAKSGCEWWAQIREPGGKNSTIGFHWDKDEQLNTAHPEIFVQPQLGTVTYLSDCGAPTVVLPLRISSDGSGEVIPSGSDGYMSFPSIGKHMVFDGRLLHGAPEDLRPTNMSEAEKGATSMAASAEGTRYTFLTNIWLDHRPLFKRPCPPATIEKMVQNEGEHAGLGIERGEGGQGGSERAGGKAEQCFTTNSSVTETAQPNREDEDIYCISLMEAERKAGEERTLRVDVNSMGHGHSHSEGMDLSTSDHLQGGELWEQWERRNYSVDQVQENIYALGCDVPTVHHIARASQQRREQQQPRKQQLPRYDSLVVEYEHAASEDSVAGTATRKAQLYLGPSSKDPSKAKAGVEPSKAKAGVEPSKAKAGIAGGATAKKARAK